MKTTILSTIVLLAAFTTAKAVDPNTVVVSYSGSQATVTIASNISSYVTVKSSGSHVKLVQSPQFTGINANADNEDGEIFYILTGSSTDGEFYLEGSYKCSLQLNGLTLTNPSGPAINIQNGKRVEVSVKKGTTNTLADGANDAYKGCFHCKGHTKFKGKGVLNIVGNSHHAIYSDEYLEVKNATINVNAAQKDGIHCGEYFLMESGTLSISGVADDGIQVTIEGDTPTGITPKHEDENTGNFYMTDGTLNISSYGGKAIKADGTITYEGGKQNFNTADVQANVFAGISPVSLTRGQRFTQLFDLLGRPVSAARPGTLLLLRQNGKTVKKISR